MTTYVMLANWTDEGALKVKHSVADWRSRRFA
jgi:uncharacterized protein with GYD domain